MYTLGQAAKAAGISKAWLSKSIQKGKVSANKDESGRYQIDPAELHRVFPPVNTVNGNSEQEETPETATENTGLSLTIEHLRELLRRTERERDELSRRLDEEANERRQNAAEIRRLTLMLTHQPDTNYDTPSALPNIKQQPKAHAVVRPWLWVALAVSSVAAAIAQWLVYRG
jgi:hypothetical protein